MFVAAVDAYADTDADRIAIRHAHPKTHALAKVEGYAVAVGDAVVDAITLFVFVFLILSFLVLAIPIPSGIGIAAAIVLLFILILGLVFFLPGSKCRRKGLEG